MPLSFDIRTGNPISGAISLGAMGDSYYEYLLKVRQMPAGFSCTPAPQAVHGPLPASSLTLLLLFPAGVCRDKKGLDGVRARGWGALGIRHQKGSFGVYSHACRNCECCLCCRCGS